MTCMAFDRSKRCLYTGGEAGEERLEDGPTAGRGGETLELLLGPAAGALRRPQCDDLMGI